MTAETPPPTDAPKPRRPRLRHAAFASFGIVVLAIVAIAAGIAYLLSEAGLPLVLARLIAETGGRLSIEGPSGSLASTMRFRRLAWEGNESKVVATDVVVEWQALALFSRRVAIRGLGASNLAISIKPSSGATAPPLSLELPLAVEIDHVTVATLDLQAGPRTGRITGIEFGYEGGAETHRLRGLRLVTDFGAIEGEATMRATAPFQLDGRVAIVGDGPLRGARLDTTLSGTLANLGIDARGTMRDATLAAHAVLTPFAGVPFDTATATLGGVDLETFHASLPRTKLELTFDARPRDGGLAGAFRATNAAPGTIADERLPLATAAGNYAYAANVLSLAALEIGLQGGGRASGEGRVDLAGADAPSRWRLTVRDLDLARIHPALAATRLSGSLSADIESARQTLAGDVRQASLAIAFEATYANRRLEVSRFRAEANGGTLTGSGRLAIDTPRAFDVALSARKFDPARFAALPAGSLDGTIKASGTLAPEWRATADVTLAPGSRWSGVAVAGHANGTVTRQTLSGAMIDAHLGSAHVTASGSAGVPGDRLAFVVDAPKLDDVNALLPPQVPRPLGGRVHATGTLALEPGGIGGDIDLAASALHVGADFAAQAMTVKASFAPGGPGNSSIALDARPLAAVVTATGVSAPSVALASMSVEVKGTLANHTASIAAKGASIDATAEIAGAVAGVGPRAQATPTWNGRITSLANHGEVPFALLQPATLDIGRGRVRFGEAHIAVADGHVDIADFEWNDGRISTHGSLDAMPVASIGRLAGKPLPFASTLRLAGTWSIAATPRLTGTFALRRESGDLYGAAENAPLAPDIALGIDTLEVTGSFRDDALDARMSFRSARSGNAQGTLRLGAVPGAPPSRIARNAPLIATLDAELASLAPLQPWLGTSAVLNGNARIALTGRGTLDAPIFAGDVALDSLRIDAPQYGIYLREGRVRAHLADGGVMVDEISIAGGDGHFTASGTIASRAAAGSEPRTHIAWRADNFRVTNRPDLRLVVAGEGSLTLVQKRVALAGNVRVVEGRIEYDPAPVGQLGSDVIVKGRPQRPVAREGLGDLPLTLDVEVDLGHRLTFQGGGLEASLEGGVRITTLQDGRLNGKGAIIASNGTYFAFGQKLTIERGRLVFDGPIDNPALDVVALRKNLAVEAGVEVTGTVRLPRVRVTSNPPVPENEALAWLVTGEGLNSGRGSDYAALSAASAALLSRGGKPLTTEIAESMGLDDITVRGGGIGGGLFGNASGVAGTQGQVIVFGKRITDRLTLGYEQGLSIAANALRLEYTLTNTLTVRAEAGAISGVGIYYRRSYD